MNMGPLKGRGQIIHGAIAVTAITPLLNLNLNYEKLHVKYTKSFKENNYLKRFFMLFLLILSKICEKRPLRVPKNRKFGQKSLRLTRCPKKISYGYLSFDARSQPQNNNNSSHC